MSYKPRYEKGDLLINDSGYIIRVDSVTESGCYLSSSWHRGRRDFFAIGYRQADWVDRQFFPYRFGRRSLAL